MDRITDESYRLLEELDDCVYMLNLLRETAEIAYSTKLIIGRYKTAMGNVERAVNALKEGVEEYQMYYLKKGEEYERSIQSCARS